MPKLPTAVVPTAIGFFCRCSCLSAIGRKRFHWNQDKMLRYKRNGEQCPARPEIFQIPLIDRQHTIWIHTACKLKSGSISFIAVDPASSTTAELCPAVVQNLSMAVPYDSGNRQTISLYRAWASNVHRNTAAANCSAKLR